MPAPFVTCGGFTLPIESGGVVVFNDAGGVPVAASAVNDFPTGAGTGTGTDFEPPRVTSGGFTFPIEAALLVFNDGGAPVAVSAATPLPTV